MAEDSTLLGAVYTTLQKMATERRPHRAGVFYPSGIAECTRQVYYGFIGQKATEPKRPKDMLLLEHGNAIHEVLHAVFRHMYGTRYKEEQPFKTTHPMSGRMDGIVTLNSKHASGERKGKNIKFGVEFKSINHARYKQLKAPKESHVVQAMIYMKAFDLDFMHIMYYDKNDQGDDPKDRDGIQLKDFRVDYDKGIINMIDNKVRIVKAAAEKKEPPPREVTPLCGWCDYLGECKPNL